MALSAMLLGTSIDDANMAGGRHCDGLALVLACCRRSAIFPPFVTCLFFHKLGVCC